MAAHTVSVLTNYLYKELVYNSASTTITGKFVKEICKLLGKCGFDIKTTNEYDDTVADAVAEFQAMAGITASGTLNDTTYQTMLLYADRLNDTIEDGDEEESTSSQTQSTSPHYNSFFDTDKYKIHRLNHKDIKIAFGNNSVTKVIKDVFMRGVTVEVDTSGNPISEVYEFIARDIKESDEMSDMLKYTGSERDKISSDIKYNYNTHSGGGRDFSTNNTHSGGGASFSSSNSHSGGGASFSSNNSSGGGREF